ncbi:unnamed protein product [Litomosoides sigmodontis]|uniref:PH domain-containing protein n=1 Tax=Litomosoides sigmodontis TaxID=42156 RepID=A0A3P6U6N2_LITSI|nr:unnamed protein product [Litomosoides sigmodontis]
MRYFRLGFSDGTLKAVALVDVLFVMEDDNAIDIYKWMFSTNSDDKFYDQMEMESNGTLKKVELKIRSNLLGVRYCKEEPIEPLIIVLEKVYLETLPDKDGKFPFMLNLDSGSIVFFSESKKQREEWMVKMSTCSHRMAQAELDEIADSFFNTCTVSTFTPASNSMNSFYLTNPVRKTYKFSISQNVSLHSRKIVCEEVMWESKLCTTLPMQLVKLYLKWCNEMSEQLKSRLSCVPNEYLDPVHDCLRHLSANQEIFVNSLEFLESYAGPSFRSSTEKFRVAFASVPTNLHLQQFSVEGHSYSYLTVGTASAIPLRFARGGLAKQLNSLCNSVNNPKQVDHILDCRFYRRRRILQNAKCTIGELSRKIDTEWHIADFGKVDKTGIQLMADIKQLHENLIDLIGSFPVVSTLIDYLSHWSRTQSSTTRLPHEKGKHFIPDGLDNQLDTIEAFLISLNTKMAVIDSVPNNEDSRKEYMNNARQTFNSVLDALLQLTESLLDAQLLGLVLALKKSSDCQLYFHIQLRSDLVLSQAITIVTTGLLALLEQESSKPPDWSIVAPLVTVFSFLSCYGDERGMMEDARECWTALHDRVLFKFRHTTSSVSSVCVPTVSGDRSRLIVQVPLPHNVYESLSEPLRSGCTFSVNTVFWNLGINHEATLSQSIAGDSSLEPSINLAAVKALASYASTLKDISHTVEELVADLTATVEANPTNKNISIFRLVMAANTALHGISVLCCKSGKDRTSMAITYEEGRVIRENCGVTAEQMGEMIVCLRREGVRRENCRKNIGKALYSFSPFQINFIPKEFRPPSGTFAQGIAS